MSDNAENRPKRALAVDDDETTLTIIRKMLEAEGMAVDVAFNALTALDLVERRPYDVIFCDMWMPGMTGADFYRKITESHPQYRTRTIFITGDIASEATWDFIEERRLPYVLKPFALAELRKKLTEVIGEWKSSAVPVPVKSWAESGADKRKHRRVGMKATVRVRKKRWATGGPEISPIVNASKEGVLFITEQEYRPGTDVWVAFPYTGTNDVDQDGFIVRVDTRPDGKKAVAIAMGEAAGRCRASLLGSDEERRRNKILAMADLARQAPTLDVIAEDIAVSAELKARFAAEREQTRRLAEELIDLKATYDSVEQQRDRLAVEEITLNAKLAELIAAKNSMTGVVEDLKKQMHELQRQLDSSDQLRYQATHDALTNLWNRAAIMDILKRELARARGEKSSLGLIVADLDHFKTINDSHGHPAGDAVLQEAARRMVDAVRDYDSVGRYGGEEFVIVLSGCDTETTVRQAERIREQLSSREIDAGTARLRVTTSMGVATSAMEGSAEDLFKAADEALYRAKRAGRDRVVVAEDGRAPAADSAKLPTLSR